MKKLVLVIAAAASLLSLSACAYDDDRYDHGDWGRGRHHDRDGHHDRDHDGDHDHDHDGDHHHDSY